jgi:TonB family protein
LSPVPTSVASERPTRPADAVRVSDREGRRSRERLRWTLIGSTWIHLLAVVAFQCSPSPSELEDSTTALTLMAIEHLQTDVQTPALEDAGSALERLSERAVIVQSDARDALREVIALEQALPTTMDDPGSLSSAMAEAYAFEAVLEATSPLASHTLAALALAESDVSAAVEELQVIAIAADVLSRSAARLDEQSTAVQVPTSRFAQPEQALAELVADALSTLAPDITTPVPGSAAGRASQTAHDRPLAAQNAPPTSPDVALTDAAAEERPDAIASEEEEFPPVPVEEQVPPEILQKFIHSDETAEPEASEFAEYISADDANDDDIRRRQVTAQAEGAATLWQNGNQSSPAAPQMEVDEGEAADPMGEPEEAAAQEVVEDRPQGGGQQGLESSEGAQGEQGPSTDGGAAAAAATGGAEARISAGQGEVAAAGRTGNVAIAGVAGTPTTGADGAAESVAPLANSNATGAESGWWRPMASRIVAPARPSTPAAAAPTEAAVSPTQSDGIAEVERPEEQDDFGGAEEADDTAAAPTDADIPAKTVGEIEERQPAVDPIADLRADLGWGGIDRTRLQPRARPSGQFGMAGQNAMSQQRVLDPEFDVDTISYVQARGTEIGEYTEKVYDEVQKAWYEMDLSDDEKALGIQGDVTIIFHVRRNGRVDDLSVLRSSGHALLDSMALAAVPNKLPRIPRKIQNSELLQQITFHYRNPLVSSPMLAPR